MKPVIRPANGILRDMTSTVRLLVDDMLSDACKIMLDEQQYRLLTRALDQIEALGDINFVLEACIDHRPGHLVRWSNGGNKQQDAAVDEIMRILIEDLGFTADLQEPAL